MATQTKNTSYPGKAFQFLSDCREELTKVTKPTRAESTQATIVTLIIMFFVALVLALLDVIFHQVMKVVL